MSSLKFDLWDSSGSRGSIEVPLPSRWYYRWPLRFLAWAWAIVAEAELRLSECDICGVTGGHAPYCVKVGYRR